MSTTETHEKPSGVLALRQVFGDIRIWLWAAGLVALIGVMSLLSAPQQADKPGALQKEEAAKQLTGSANAESLKAKDPVLYAVFFGTLPAVDQKLPLGEAFAKYPWFAQAPKWASQGQPGSKTVIVSAPLAMPEDVRQLGVGSGSAMVFFVTEFGLSGDSKSFKPLKSGLEVRDGQNKLIARVEDPRHTLLLRVVRGQEHGVGLALSISGK